MFWALPLLFLAGLVLSGILFKHRRISTYLAAAAILTQVMWMVIVFLARTILQSVDPVIVYAIGAAVLLVSTFFIARHSTFTFPWGKERHDVVGDIVVICVTLGMLLAVFIIVRANGFTEHEWKTHGFYNGDTATFIALTQRSILTPTLLEQNPFAGNGPLEYPTVLHGALASLIGKRVGSWLYFLPLLTYVTIAATIPMFFLLWDVLAPMKKGTAWSIITIGLVITASFDSYVYPQSHFFLTGMFLLVAALLYQGIQAKQYSRPIIEGAAFLSALVLLVSNAVTGTAALALLVLYTLFIWTHKTPQPTRLLACGASIIGVLLFLFLTPGEASLQTIGFSYTAAPDVLRLTPLLALLLFGAYQYRKQQPVVFGLVTTLSALTIIVFIFSGRDIVVANASRFLYHALLVGFPVIGLVLANVWPTLKSTVTSIPRQFDSIVTWGALIVACFVLVLPSLASVASAYDNLLFQDERVVDTATRAAMWWIEDNVPADAIFIANPEPPFAIPVFTGRSLLRTDYWLSPNDIVLGDMRAALMGDVAAWEHVISFADYLLLTQVEQSQFGSVPETFVKVFDNNAIAIYQLPK